ncbi:HTTM domain-containing protein [Microlunatus sp. GCM10028923]|uniref:HTTM domain-containing protein n=1 Tax=Microlunatus sp. GCM10028923 TaxID=3273400 RepID=UPI0036126B5A
MTGRVRYALGTWTGGAWEVLRSTVGASGKFAYGWLTESKHALYGLAVGRVLLGVTGLGLLLTNFSTMYYFAGSGSAWNGEGVEPISSFPKIWIFSLFRAAAFNDFAFTALYIALAALAVLVIVGFKSRIVIPVYFVGWVSFIELNDAVGDQGDNMYRIVLLTMIFADTSARWSVDAWIRANRPDSRLNFDVIRKLVPEWASATVNNLALVSIACHVCFVYASGALFKAGGEPWRTGYAIYSPLKTLRFGVFPELSDLVLASAPLVAAICWSTIILQMVFPVALLNRFSRIIALVGITGFHIGIAVLMGLPWFSMAMIAIDTIFIRDVTWQAIGELFRRGVQAGRDSSPELRKASSARPLPAVHGAAAPFAKKPREDAVKGARV